MNDELRQRIIERLRRGEDLPREWARDIFPPEKMEYELVYHGKEREGDILANTMAVPLQEVRTFGKANGDAWRNMLILGDNLQVLKRLVEMKREGRLCNADGTPGVRLVYIDPPFATKQEFSGKQDERAYRDKVIGAEFVEFLRKRLVLLHELVAIDGNIIVHLDNRKVHYIKVILDEIFGENNFVNEIIWHKGREGGSSRSHSPSSAMPTEYQNLLIYSLNKSQRTLSTRERQAQHVGAAELRDNKAYFWTDLTQGGLADEELEFFAEAREPDSGYKMYPVGNHFHFKTPLNAVIADSSNERVFIKHLISPDNLPPLAAWIKNTAVRFYDIEYAWLKGEHRVRGWFSPDFFIKLVQPLMLVVEIKDDDEIKEPADENYAKYKYAQDHFQRVNSHLEADGETLRYQFNFLTPSDYLVFFKRLREGHIEGYQSNLDIRLMEKL
jgi:hypothetical protein